MTQRRARSIVVALLGFMVVALCIALWFDHLERAAGRPDLGRIDAEIVSYLVGMFAASVVGAIVVLARPRHPVGWLFIALGAVMFASAPLAEYAEYGLLARPGSLPGASLAAVVDNSIWIPWLVLVALILFLTPNGQHLSTRWRLVARLTVVAGALGLLLDYPSAEPLDAPFSEVASPTRVDAIQPAADLVGRFCILLVGLGLIVSAISLLVRYHRSRGDERRQLLWLVFVVVPLPIFVVLSYSGAFLDQPLVADLAPAGFVTLVPVAAGLSVLRFRLYDVERIVAATVTWVLLSTVLVATYGLVVWLGARAVPTGPVSPLVSATVGAVVAAGLAFPLRRALQDQVDRRFNRRAYDARRVIGTALAAEDAGIDVESVLREALHDPELTVAYPDPDGGWVRADGASAPLVGGHVEVDRHGRVIARIGFDPDRNDADAVRRGAALAAAELDNARLRAELARQVGEIAASRARLAGVQRRERRRIERDLHDGAQQSLLALAFELQSAQLNGDPGRMRQALTDGASAAQAAVRELRDLANGLHPAALTDGGLAAALDDMARHSPVPLRVRAESGRLDPGTEFTAWSVIGEAVVNAQKHAAAHGIEVDVQRQNGDLRLRVHDDGRGGANPDGPGLRGLRDRVEAARGRLTVSTGVDGTTVEAVLPCGS
jgi:signal transduction histidine kinase